MSDPNNSWQRNKWHERLRRRRKLLRNERAREENEAFREAEEKMLKTGAVDPPKGLKEDLLKQLDDIPQQKVRAKSMAATENSALWLLGRPAWQIIVTVGGLSALWYKYRKNKP